ncbi:MAG: HepT-like ribonuclease domain-containing protein [Pirellulales bacterium]
MLPLAGTLISRFAWSRRVYPAPPQRPETRAGGLLRVEATHHGRPLVPPPHKAKLFTAHALAERMRRMARFRNIAVHDYRQLDQASGAVSAKRSPCHAGSAQPMTAFDGGEPQ